MNKTLKETTRQQEVMLDNEVLEQFKESERRLSILRLLSESNELPIEQQMRNWMESVKKNGVIKQ